MSSPSLQFTDWARSVQALQGHASPAHAFRKHAHATPPGARQPREAAWPRDLTLRDLLFRLQAARVPWQACGGPVACPELDFGELSRAVEGMAWGEPGRTLHRRLVPLPRAAILRRGRPCLHQRPVLRGDHEMHRLHLYLPAQAGIVPRAGAQHLAHAFQTHGNIHIVRNGACNL
jgi:hypothetical protein